MTRLMRITAAGAVMIAVAISAPSTFAYPAPGEPVARVPSSHSVPSASHHFEWGDAAVGAAVMLALVSLGGGVATRIGRSRRRHYVARTI